MKINTKNDKIMEKRRFFIVDDTNENFYVAQFERAEKEVKPELWALKPGEYLPINETRAYTR